MLILQFIGEKKQMPDHMCIFVLCRTATRTFPPAQFLFVLQEGKQHREGSGGALLIVFNQAGAESTYTGDVLQWLCLQIQVPTWDQGCSLDCKIPHIHSFWSGFHMPISMCNLALAFHVHPRLFTGAVTALFGTKMPLLWMCESRTHLLLCCV